MFNQLISILVNGITISSTYAIVAIGLSLVYGVSKTFNYAYGSFATVGAYITWLLFSMFDWMNYPVAFMVMIPFMFLFGIVIEWLIPRPLRKNDNWEITTVVATLGLGVLLNNLVLFLFGPYTKALPELGGGSLRIAHVQLDWNRIVILILAVVIVIALKLFLKKTYIGMSMRAVAQDIEGARVVGMKINQIFALTFGISTVLAGLCGILLGTMYFLTPSGGWDIFIKAFVIVALGGAGSIDGALYAAFILGISESFIQYSMGPIWVMPFWFIFLMAVLIFKPRGLLGIR